MPTETAPPLFIKYALTVSLIGSATLCFHCFFRLRQPPIGVAPWQTQWRSFGILAWTLFCSVLLVQFILNTGKLSLDSPDAKAWQVLRSGFGTHLALLGTFYGFCRFYSTCFPQHLNTVSLPLTTALPKALYYLLLTLPFLAAWGLITSYFQRVGQQPTVLDPQPLVRIVAETQSLLAFLLLALLAIGIAPISEELIFRGTLYRFLKGRVRPTTALILSAIVFAGFHLPTLVYAIPLFILGLLLGYSYERTGNLTVPILFHALFNANTVIAIVLIRL